MSEFSREFGGVIGDTVADSTPWWPEPRRAPAGAPNIVVIVLDDVGFADFGCYGSEIATPVGTSQCNSSYVPIRSKARSTAGMRSSVQPVR